MHRVAFERAGARIAIREATAFEVRLAMIPIYSFEHEARQIWENGRAVRIDATTNKNGKELQITVRPWPRYIRTVNGRVDKFDGSMAVLAFWYKDTLRHHAFFSAVEDQTIRASFEFAGKERITIAGADLDVDHYRMVGTRSASSGTMRPDTSPRVRLSRLGSEIELLHHRGGALVLRLGAAAPASRGSCRPTSRRGRSGACWLSHASRGAESVGGSPVCLLSGIPRKTRRLQ